MSNKRIFLIDGTGILYRAYYAFISRPMTTTRGENTSAIFGFLKILLQIIKEYNPDSILIAFDKTRDTFRRQIYPEYKIHREETPQDLKSQIPALIDILEKMGIKVIEMDEFEADDIIGTLSNNLRNNNEVYIITGDKDLIQLIDNNVKIIRPIKGLSEIEILDKISAKEKVGILPEQIPDYLALVGDTSDNIPGVKGIGDKGAVNLLTKYKTIEDIYNNIEEIKWAIQQKLINDKENAFISKKLATIKRDIPLDIDELIKPFLLENMLNEQVINKLSYFQLNSIIMELKKLKSKNVNISEDLFSFQNEENSIQKDMVKGDYFVIKTKDDLFKLIDEIKKINIFSIDTETTSEYQWNSEIVCITISLNEGTGYFIPVLYNAGQDFDKEFVFETLKPILEDDDIKKIGQNIKFEIEVFSNYGIDMKGIYFDTMIAAYLLNPVRTHNNLDTLSIEYLGIGKSSFEDLLTKENKKNKSLLNVSLNDLVNYSCGDSDLALRLKNILVNLIKSSNLDNVMYNIEMPLVSVLAEIEKNGVKIDVEKLKSISNELDELIKKSENKIYFLAGKEFNINSPIQLSKILFEDLKLEPTKMTEGGKYSTDEETLEELSMIHPLPAEILNYRTYFKLKNTYVDALPELIFKKTGRIHTNYNQTVTATGRLSSSDPNLQNIPIRDEIGRKIREAFIADDGNYLVSADYSQIELRVLAHFCKDPNMLKAFNENLDIHKHTASLIYKVPESEVNEEMRRRAKSVNFGIIYGLQAYGLSRQLKISMTEAKNFIKNYFENFPYVKNFINEVINQVAKTGEVRTISGRYRKFPDLYNKKNLNPDHLNASQRMALNTLIQGTAADIMKIAMINMYNFLKSNKLRSKIILQIHDELVLEVPENELDFIMKSLKDIMENAYKLEIPLVVDLGYGKNWADAHQDK